MGEEPSPAADIYSFGVVLWEICCQEAPQRGRRRDPTPAEAPLVRSRPANRSVPGRPKCSRNAAFGRRPMSNLLRVSRASAPCTEQEVAAIIQTCLRFKPEQRPSAKEVLALLELVAALETPPQGGPSENRHRWQLLFSTLLGCCCSLSCLCAARPLNLGWASQTHAAASATCRCASRRQHGGSGGVQGLHRGLGAPAALRQHPPPQLRLSRLSRRPQGM